MLDKILDKYYFRWGAEVGYGALVAAIVYAAQVVGSTDYEIVAEDPEKFFYSLAAGVGRVLVAAVVNGLRKIFIGGD